MSLLMQVAFCAFCLLLSASAFVGWRRTRLWWLALLALAPLMLAAGTSLNWMYSIVVIAKPHQSQFEPQQYLNVPYAIGLWIRFAGWIAAGIGGVAAIHEAIKHPADEKLSHAP